MVKYRVYYSYFSDVVEASEETTDYGAIVDLLIDKLEEDGCEGVFLDPEQTQEEGGDIYPDEYISGGNRGRLLYHGGNFHIQLIA